MSLFAKKPDSLGQFEQLVLTAVMSVGKEAYGSPIYDKVCEMADKRVNMGGVYVTLDRLEDAGIDALRESVETSQRIADVFEESWGIGKWKFRRRRV